jgi:hypothetical protein
MPGDGRSLLERRMFTASSQGRSTGAFWAKPVPKSGSLTCQAFKETFGQADLQEETAFPRRTATTVESRRYVISFSACGGAHVGSTARDQILRTSWYCLSKPGDIFYGTRCRFLAARQPQHHVVFANGESGPVHVCGPQLGYYSAAPAYTFVRTCGVHVYEGCEID